MTADKLKILIDTSPLENAHAVRGVGTYTRFLTKALEKLNTIEVYRSTQKPKKKFKPDVIHYPYFDLFRATLPVIKTAKSVVTIHDVIPLMFPEHYPPGIRGKLKLSKQRLALKTVNKVITDSKASVQDIHQLLKIPLNKIDVVYLAANPNIKSQPQSVIDKVKNKYNLPKNYALYVGDINYNKNLPQLIKAFKYLPERIHLVLVGKNFIPRDIPEWQWIESQIAMSKVVGKVHFVPEIETSQARELSAVYSGAVCYIQPSLYEGFGLPVLEAMQAGTPVIAAKNSSLIEVGNGHVILVEPEAESIANAIKQILAWPEEKKAEVIQQALQWSNSFSWEKTAQETLEVYQSLFK
jgi:glycosyltransferase involved in cell wall biosynthesis